MIRFYFILLIVFISSLSCTDNKNSYTEEEYKIIDSIYYVRKKEYKTKLDTLCDSIYNKNFPVMVDSIKKIRKKEILDLIKK